jgi:hypothetical protein
MLTSEWNPSTLFLSDITTEVSNRRHLYNCSLKKRIWYLLSPVRLSSVSVQNVTYLAPILQYLSPSNRNIQKLSAWPPCCFTLNKEDTVTKSACSPKICSRATSRNPELSDVNFGLRSRNFCFRHVVITCWSKLRNDGAEMASKGVAFVPSLVKIDQLF